MSEPLAFTVHRHRCVGSTSDLARRMAHEGAPEGTVVVADEQTQGRGRRGRGWHSPPGSGLYLSLVLRPTTSPAQLPRLTVLAAVGVARAVRDLLGLEAVIKWPNDIWIHGLKVAGILAEATPGRGEAAGSVILGVGINTGPCAFPPPLDHTATSLCQQLGRPVDSGAVLGAVLAQISALYTSWRQSHWSRESWTEILGAYRSLCLTVGQEVAVMSCRDQYRAQAVAVDDDGNLVVRLSDGTARTVLAADVSIGSGYGL